MGIKRSAGKRSTVIAHKNLKANPHTLNCNLALLSLVIYVYVSWYLVTGFALHCMREHFHLKRHIWPMAWQLQLCEMIMDLVHHFEVIKLLYMQKIMLVALGLLCTYDLRYLHSHIFNKVDLCNKATEKLLWVGFLVLNSMEELFILINNKLTEMWHEFALKFCQYEQCWCPKFKNERRR